MNEFALAWLIYALAALGTFAGIWYLTRTWRPLLRDLARVLVLILLAVPSPVVGFAEHYAPAAMVATFEGLFQRSGDPAPALAALATAMLAGLVLVLVLALLRWVWRMRKPPPPDLPPEADGSG